MQALLPKVVAGRVFDLPLLRMLILLTVGIIGREIGNIAHDTQPHVTKVVVFI